MAVQIILKNSTIEDKRPTPSQLTSGELSLNYNAAGAFLCCTDTDGNVQQVGGIKINETAPSTPVTQTLWLQPSTQTLSIYDGSAWIPVVGSDGVAPVTSVNTQTGDVVLDFSDVGAASAAQGALADTALQPGDDVSELVNDAAYITLADVPPIPPQTPPVITSSTAPLDADSENGYLWFNTNDGRTYVYYQDADSSQWVDASPESADPGILPDPTDPAQQPGTLDDRYVNITGDNMSGDLTIGTSNIILNTDGTSQFAGAGQFAGEVTVGPLSEITLSPDGSVVSVGSIKASATGDNEERAQMLSSGSIIAYRNDGSIDAWSALSANPSEAVGSLGPKIFAGGEYEAGTSTKVATAWITKTGDATFAGDIRSVTQNDGALSGFRSQVINGNFRVIQRLNDYNTTQTVTLNTLQYFADHWAYLSQNTGTCRVNTSAVFPNYVMQQGVSVSGLRQPIELPADGACGPFAIGTRWTASVWSDAALDAAPFVGPVLVFGDGSGDTTNQVVAAPTSPWVSTGQTVNGYTKYSSTQVIDAAPAVTNKCLDFIIQGKNVVSTSALGYAEAQLEPGPVATPFEQRFIGTELSLCQRYFQVIELGSSNQAEFAMVTSGNSSANCAPHILYLAPMRDVGGAGNLVVDRTNMTAASGANTFTGAGSVRTPVNRAKGANGSYVLALGCSDPPTNTTFSLRIGGSVTISAEL